MFTMNDTTEATTETNEIPKFHPDVSNRYRMLDKLLNNPLNYSLDVLKKELKMTDSGLRSTIGRIRKDKKRGYKIIIINKNLSIRVKGKKPTIENIIQNIHDGNESLKYYRNNTGVKAIMTHQEMVNKASNHRDNLLRILERYPDGIKMEDLINESGFDHQQIYNITHALRKKGYRVLSTNGIYKLYENDSNEVIIPKKPKPSPKSPALPFNSSLIPPEYMGMFNNLPDNDKVDCIDMLKKALYYRSSAIALIESNQLAFNFVKQYSQRRDTHYD